MCGTLKCGTLKCGTMICAAICATNCAAMHAVQRRFYFPPLTTRSGAAPTAEKPGLRSDPLASDDLPCGVSPGHRSCGAARGAASPRVVPATARPEYGKL